MSPAPTILVPIGVDERSMSWKSASWLNDNSRTALSQLWNSWIVSSDSFFLKFLCPIAQLSRLLAVILLLWHSSVILVDPVSGNQVLICSDFPSTLVNHLEMCWLFHGIVPQNFHPLGLVEGTCPAQIPSSPRFFWKSQTFLVFALKNPEKGFNQNLGIRRGLPPLVLLSFAHLDVG